LGEKMLIVIKGAGDLASGVAVRLYRCGYQLVMTELPQPLMVRRTVSFGEAVYEGEVQIEGIKASRAEDVPTARRLLQAGTIPVLIDPLTTSLAEWQPPVIIDAIMAKKNTGTRLNDAPLVIALGPGFVAGVECHAVIETNRGHRLGRVILEGCAEPDTGQPGNIAGKSEERILRAPVDGVIDAQAKIGERVTEGQMVVRVNGCEVFAGTDGILRGMIRSGLSVPAGIKIGDVDPRAEPSHCYQVSDKALAIAGGVLEAILGAPSRNRPCS
jgi:xanthine dehydrogenase accessory factor